MKDAIFKWFTGWNDIPDQHISKIAERFMSFMKTPEFAKLYAEQIRPSHPNDGVEITLTINGVKDMSNLTDAMNAALTNLQSKIGTGATPDQLTAAVHAVVDPTIADLTSKIAAIQASESDDATKIADVTAAITEFTTALAPAGTPAAATDANSTTAALNTGAAAAANA